MRNRPFMLRLTDAEFADLSRRAGIDRRSISSYIRTLIFPSVLPVEKPEPPTKPLTCKQCGHQWAPKVPNPKQCPECKASDWNRTRAESYADFETRFSAEAAAIGITSDEYNRQEQVIMQDMDVDEIKAFTRRWKRIKTESGVSAETWEAAKWITRKPPSIIAALESEKNLFDAIQAKKGLDR